MLDAVLCNLDVMPNINPDLSSYLEKYTTYHFEKHEPSLC